MKPPATGLPDHEARRLLQIALATDPSGVALKTHLNREEARHFEQLVARRLTGEPLQYIEGTVQFGPLELLCDRRALIPRPETEYLWEIAVKHDGPAPEVIVDLGTGSGNLALALKHSYPDATVFATDLSSEALALANENVAYTGLTVETLQGDLWQALPPDLEGRIDLLVSNPPYVSKRAELPAEVVEHEPGLALFAGPAGTEVLERIASGLSQWLSPDGRFCVEIGEEQAGAVEQIFSALDHEILPDLAGRPRIVRSRM